MKLKLSSLAAATKKSQIMLLLALMISSVALAQNPLVTHIYTADPTARVHEGKLYIYPSCDIVPTKEDGKKGFVMPGYHIFSLEGGSTWHDYGMTLHCDQVPWGEKGTNSMWAPDCIEKDGKYYYYYPAKPLNDRAFRRIGVGISDSPSGPFEWEPTFIDGVSGIDPGLLLDDADNQAYLFFGGGQELFVAPLGDDMKSITEPAIKIEGLPAGYKEGSFPIKIDGVYYLTFAHVFADEGYTIGYATSDNPMGPYLYRGKIMDNIAQGTNHHSIVKYKDQWILFYHFWHISGVNKMRSMCADYMHFKPDGTIAKVKPTLRGIGSPMQGDTIQIDRYNTIHKAQTAMVSGDEPTGWMVCEAEAYSNVTFNDVDFGDGTAKKMLARVACGQRFGEIQIRTNGPQGELIATFPLHYTGGWDKWVTLESDILAPITGKHNICAVFIGEGGSTKIANLNWLLMPHDQK